MMILKAKRGISLNEYVLILALVLLVAIPSALYVAQSHRHLLGELPQISHLSHLSQMTSPTVLAPDKHPPSGNENPSPLPAVSPSHPSSGVPFSGSNIFSVDAKTGTITVSSLSTGSGVNSTSVEGQMMQAPQATNIVSQTILNLGNRRRQNRRLQNQPLNDPILVQEIQKLGMLGVQLASDEHAYLSQLDGIAVQAGEDYVAIGQLFEQIEQRIDYLSQQNPSVDYTALNQELTQLTALIEKIMDQNFLEAPIAPGVNAPTNIAYAPSEKKMINLYFNSNIKNVKGIHIQNAAYDAKMLNNTTDIFKNVNLNMNMINRDLASQTTANTANQILTIGQ